MQLPAEMRRDLFFYLRELRKESGGYSATPKLPATVQDTYHALSIITTLGGEEEMKLAADAPLRRYLAEVAGIDRHDAKITYQQLACCRMMGLTIDQERIEFFVNRRISETADLEERYFCCRIDRETLAGEGERFMTLVGPARNWSFRVASELMMLLYLGQGAYHGSERTFIAWLQRCQGFDGGFGFLPGTTSFVDNCYDCLAALALLQSPPADPTACLRYILACRTTRGGFARKNGAAAFLSSTWHAVAALSLLAPHLKPESVSIR